MRVIRKTLRLMPLPRRETGLNSLFVQLGGVDETPGNAEETPLPRPRLSRKAQGNQQFGVPQICRTVF